jgi:hypothetical protein
MYVFGGEHEPRVPIGSTVHRLDLETKEWSECKPIYIFLEEGLKKSLKITKG